MAIYQDARLDSYIGKHIVATYVAGSVEKKVAGVLRSLHHDFKLEVDNLVLPIVGVTGAVRSVHIDNKPVYENPHIKKPYKGMFDMGKRAKLMQKTFGSDIGDRLD
ncbi:MAG: hypothetical protein ACMXYF_02880, partial [Candidatus Woesearchaeota archaeon]